MASMSTKPSEITVATFNVHEWGDAKMRDNVDRVAAVVRRESPDVLCLQETNATGQHRFMRTLREYKYSLSQWSCAILSKYPIKPASLGENQSYHSVRFATAKICLDADPANFKDAQDESQHGDDHVIVTCLHLDYRVEPTRMMELNRLKLYLSDHFADDSPQIWTGDFNALTREDYTDDYWEKTVVAVRRRNNWELPETKVTNKMKDIGFVDTWAECGRPAPVGTCRFDTRIDYVYASKSFLARHGLLSVRHVVDDASDHNMVVAKFKM